MTAEKGGALDCWAEIAGRLKKAHRIALFLDFDGTLAEFCIRPEDVTINAGAREALGGLVHSRRFSVWIVSGRRHADIRDRVGVPGIHYLGLYGWEARAERLPGDDTRQNLACISAWMKALLAGAPRVWIEEKQHTLAVHHRGASHEEAELAKKVVDFVVGPFAQEFRIEGGKSVWEVVPWELGDKGKAVRSELDRLPGDTLPVYLGDDLSDEAAFAALPEGITVHVGEGRVSKAQYRLEGVEKVRTFLSKLQSEFA